MSKSYSGAYKTAQDWTDSGDTDDEYADAQDGDSEGEDESDTDVDLVNEYDRRLGSRARLEDYMDDMELAEFGIVDYNAAVDFGAGELDNYLTDNGETDESSFNDDGLPMSEEQYFSSEYQESDVGDYVPPLTKTKKVLIYRLMQYQVTDSEDEDENQAKEMMRRKALQNFHDLLRKKRAAKAYRRLMKVRDMGLDDINQEAFILEKMELVDKKLNKPFYYEEYEPASYKRLLQRRRKAIKRKYERYSLDPEYREELKSDILKNVGKYLGGEREKRARWLLERQNALDAESESETRSESDDPEFLPQAESTRYKIELPDSEDDEDLEAVSECSSFYDDIISDSELEFFSSDYEEDCSVHYPGAQSKTINRYRRYLSKCQSQIFDTAEQKLEKKIRQAEIEAQFRNYLEKRRAYKALARVRMVLAMNIRIPIKEAECHLHLEVYDKKLHRKYYYGPDEPNTYKILLGKRRRALTRKYEKFAADPIYRDEVLKTVYMKVLRIQPSPIFDAEESDQDDQDYSSLNDTDVATSEEAFLSDGTIELPQDFEKPATRTKRDLYKELELYEPDATRDTESVIMEKRTRRLDIIQRHRDRLIDRRRRKTLARLEEAKRMDTNDPGILAGRLKELEIIDKKLNRGFYYTPGEPIEFKQLLEKRLRAIDRKYKKYATDRSFRDEMEYRIVSAVPKTKPIRPDYDQLMSLGALENVTQISRMAVSSTAGFEAKHARRSSLSYRHTAPAELLTLNNTK